MSRNSTFPNAWKRAFIKPIPKVSNPESLKDLTPIGVLSVLSKFLEAEVVIS